MPYPRIAFSSMFLHEYPIEKIVAGGKDAGFDSIEFWIETPHFWETRNLNLLKYIERFSNILVHAPVFDLNPSSFNEGVRSLTLKETLYSIEISKLLDAKYITIHPGRRTARRPPERKDLERFHEYLEICTDFAHFKGVDISIENLEKKVNSLYWSPEQIKKLLDEFGLYLTLDTTHAFKSDFSLPKKFVLQLSDRIINIHLSYFGKMGDHAPSRFCEDIREFLKLLKDSAYSGFITVELDDLAYTENLTFEEKIRELTEEKEFIESVF